MLEKNSQKRLKSGAQTAEKILPYVLEYPVLKARNSLCINF